MSETNLYRNNAESNETLENKFPSLTQLCWWADKQPLKEALNVRTAFATCPDEVRPASISNEEFEVLQMATNAIYEETHTNGTFEERKLWPAFTKVLSAIIKDGISDDVLGFFVAVMSFKIQNN